MISIDKTSTVNILFFNSFVLPMSPAVVCVASFVPRVDDSFVILSEYFRHYAEDYRIRFVDVNFLFGEEVVLDVKMMLWLDGFEHPLAFSATDRLVERNRLFHCDIWYEFTQQY